MTSEAPRPGPGETAEAVLPTERLAVLVRSHGAHARPLRESVALLTERDWTLRELVQATHLPRRTVEEVLGCLRDDLVHAGERFRVCPARTADYRDRFGYDQLRRTRLTDQLADRLASRPGLVDTMRELAAHAPAARTDLDHVPATAETAARRALWLESAFDLTGAHLLFVGDHDLTSLAVAAAVPGVAVTVVDVDEELLAYLDEKAAGLAGKVSCLYADLRFGLPGAATGVCDLAFTDPPYTPEGVGLFTARALRGLRDPEHGRVVVAYGHSERHPALGWKVQRAMGDLGLVFESVWPSFNVYDGAEAVGASADLYVCRPTASTWKRLDRPAGTRTDLGAIYTRGRAAVESARTGLSDDAVARLRIGVPSMSDAPCSGGELGHSNGGRGARVVFVGDDVPAGLAPDAHVKLATVLSGGLPPAATGRGPVAVVADLSDDPGPWLLRLLLAVNADRFAAAVPARHGDLGGSGWKNLTALLRPKWVPAPPAPPGTRPGPDDAYAGKTADAMIVGFTAADGHPGSSADRLVRWVLDRVHGKVGNVWSEGLVRLTADGGGPRLSKRQARSQVEAAVEASAVGAAATSIGPRRMIDPDVLGSPLIDLPRHTIRDLLTVIVSTGRECV